MSSDKTLTCNGTYSTSTKYQKDSRLLVAGSPTITSGGLVSGFSTSNYLYIDGTTSNWSSTNWAAQVCFKTTSTSGRQCLIGNIFITGYGHRGVTIYIKNGQIECVAGYQNNVTACTLLLPNTVATNKWYTVSFYLSNGTYYASESSLGSTSSTTSKTTAWSSNYGFKMGRLVGDDASTAYVAKNTTIDLANTWFKSEGNYKFYNKTTAYTYYWNKSLS